MVSGLSAQIIQNGNLEEYLPDEPSQFLENLNIQAPVAQVASSPSLFLTRATPTPFQFFTQPNFQAQLLTQPSLPPPQAFTPLPPTVLTPAPTCLLRSCDQTITGRFLSYERALQIVQNEEYLSAADIDVIKRSDQAYDYIDASDLHLLHRVLRQATSLPACCATNTCNAARQTMISCNVTSSLNQTSFGLNFGLDSAVLAGAAVLIGVGVIGIGGVGTGAIGGGAAPSVISGKSIFFN